MGQYPVWPYCPGYIVVLALDACYGYTYLLSFSYLGGLEIQCGYTGWYDSTSQSNLIFYRKSFFCIISTCGKTCHGGR